MNQSTNLMDEEIRLLLMEDDQDLQTKGLDQLLKLHQTRICRFVQGVYPYFRESELVDVLYELCRSLKKMLDEKRVDLERPISPLLFQIAKCRAHDLHRRLTAAKRHDEKYLTDMAVIIAEEGYSPHWRNLVRNGTSAQIMEEFASLLTTLPRRQAAVAQAMVDAFPNTLSLEEICDAVEAMTGERITIAAAKSARDEVRAKMREKLHAKQ